MGDLKDRIGFIETIIKKSGDRGMKMLKWAKRHPIISTVLFLIVINLITVDTHND